MRNIATILPDGSPADAELPSLALRFTGGGDQYGVFDADGSEMLSPGAGSWSAAVWVRFDEAARGEVDLMYLLSLGQRLDSDNGMSVFYTNYHNTGWKVVFSGNDERKFADHALPTSGSWVDTLLDGSGNEFGSVVLP